MNKKRNRHGARDTCKARGAINQVVRGVADAFGISRGAIIAGFVLGFIFTPLLTGLVFLAAWYWTGHPDTARRHVEWLSEQAARAAKRLNDAAFGRAERYRHAGADTDFSEDADTSSTSTASSPPPPSSAEQLKQRFEELDRRAKHIEEIVASEEYRLEREFRRIDD